MKHCSLLLFILSAFSWSVQAQNYQAIDSLLELQKTAKAEVLQQVNLQLAWEYRKSHPDSTIYFCHEAVALLGNEAMHSTYAQAMNYIGVAHHYKGNDVEAFEYYTRAMEVGREVDSIQFGHALNNLGRFYMSQGDYISSYENYNLALKIFQLKDDQMSLSYAYKSMAELYITQERYDKALEMAQKTLQLRRVNDNIRGQVSILNEIALIYLTLEDYDQALNTYDEAMLLSTVNSDKIMMARIHLGISTLHYQRNQFDKSLAESRKAKKICDGLNNQSLENEVNLQLGKVYYALGQWGVAERYLNELLNEAKQSQDLFLERDASLFLALMYRGDGRYEQAFEKFQRHHELVNVLENAANARLIERLEARIQIESTLRQNDLLRAQQEADEATKSRLKMQNILLTGGILMAFTFLLVMYLMYKRRMDVNKKLVQKNEFIADQREEIKKQNDQIARQNNILTAHNAELATLNAEKDTLMNILAHDLKAPFNRIRGLVQLFDLTDLSEEQRKYANMLNSASMDGLNLIRDLLEVSAFSNYDQQPEITTVSLREQLSSKRDEFKAEAESKHIGIAVNLEKDVMLASDPSYLSRILDNLISNAIKFSNPESEVILSGGKKNGKPYLSVKDFGPGFSEEDREKLYNKFSRLSAQPTAGESSNGLGLAIVKILVDNLNAEIDLISEKGKGSEFIISFTDQQEIFQDSR